MSWEHIIGPNPKGLVGSKIRFPFYFENNNQVSMGGIAYSL